ncbi:aspartate--tRNA ligase dps1, partial [Nowakowskiella sp. JEL0078]
MEYEEYTYYPAGMNESVPKDQKNLPPIQNKIQNAPVQKTTPSYIINSTNFLDTEERALYLASEDDVIQEITNTVIKEINTTSNVEEESGEKKLSKAQLKKLEKEQKKKETADRLAAEKASADANDSSKGLYGDLPLNQSQERSGKKRTKVVELNESLVGETVLLNLRVQNSSAKGKQLFLVFRQQKDTVQGLLMGGEKVSKQMLKWASSITDESIVLVEAIVAKTPEPIRRCTIQSVELKITKIFRTSAAERLPFGVEYAARPESEFLE